MALQIHIKLLIVDLVELQVIKSGNTTSRFYPGCFVGGGGGADPEKKFFSHAGARKIFSPSRGSGGNIVKI